MPIQPSIPAPRRLTRSRDRLAAPLAAPLVAAAALLASGCSEIATDMGLGPKAPDSVQAQVERIEPVTQSGRAAAVLSVHMRKSFPDACRFGITLANNLPFKVGTLTYRFTALIKGGVPFDSQSKSFSEIRPSERQYREMTFQGVSCDQVQTLLVSDPGRCTLGDMHRFTAEPGDCAKFTDLSSTRLASLAWKKG